jgi:hypothetical protein
MIWISARTLAKAVASSNSGIPDGCNPKHKDSTKRCQRARHCHADAGDERGSGQGQESKALRSE